MALAEERSRAATLEVRFDLSSTPTYPPATRVRTLPDLHTNYPIPPQTVSNDISSCHGPLVDVGYLLFSIHRSFGSVLLSTTPVADDRRPDQANPPYAGAMASVETICEVIEQTLGL